MTGDCDDVLPVPGGPVSGCPVCLMLYYVVYTFPVLYRPAFPLPPGCVSGVCCLGLGLYMDYSVYVVLCLFGGGGGGSANLWWAGVPFS